MGRAGGAVAAPHCSAAAAAAYFGVPWPVVPGEVAVSNPGPVRGEAVPGPAVVPVVAEVEPVAAGAPVPTLAPLEAPAR